MNTFTLLDKDTIACRICSTQLLLGMIEKHSDCEEEVAEGLTAVIVL